jgi:thiamine pyrophosphate-dependent acetolactate synthase large subunit-like protein
MITADTDLQEHPVSGPDPIPRYRPPTPPMADTAALDEAAKMLAGAAKPVIVADRLARTPDGMARLVELAEVLQAPVIDRYSRLNMPNAHPLCQTDNARGLIAGADVILGLELTDPWGAINQLLDRAPRIERRIARPDAKLIDLGTHDLSIHGNIQDHQRFEAADLPITGDGEASLPYLIDKLRTLISPGEAVRTDRRKALEAAHQAMRQRALADAAYGWDAQPIATARLCWEIWRQVKGLDWALVGGDYQFKSYWPQRLWTLDKHYQFNGGAGGAGVGYCAPAAVGSALAHREHGRVAINIQGDGDLMCGPGSLWTAAHHKIPLLTIVHNNRAYHQEYMHIQNVAGRHSRGLGRSKIGTWIDEPGIDYAKLAQGLGLWASGPIVDPAELAPAIKKALAVVKAGEPALLDVVSQPR